MPTPVQDVSTLDRTPVNVHLLERLLAVSIEFSFGSGGPRQQSQSVGVGGDGVGGGGPTAGPGRPPSILSQSSLHKLTHSMEFTLGGVCQTVIL